MSAPNETYRQDEDGSLTPVDVGQPPGPIFSTIQVLLNLGSVVLFMIAGYYLLQLFWMM